MLPWVWFSNRSQKTSKCSKNISDTLSYRLVCHFFVLTTFWRLLWSIAESDARQHGIYLFYIITKSLFYFKIFQHNAKVGLLPRLCTKKGHLTRSMIFQNETILLVAMRSKELWLVEKNRTTVKPVSSVAPRWMKTYSESRIELRNLQIFKKMLEKSSQLLVIGTALWAEIQELKKYPRKTCGHGQPRGHLIRVLNERSVKERGDFSIL